MDYARVMTALRRRRFAIALAVIGCTGLTFFGATRMPREYQAAATLMPQDPALGTMSELAAPPEAGVERGDLQAQHDRIKTVATVLMSPAVLAPVIRELNLKTTPALLAEDMHVEEVTSQILQVSVKDTDPERATRIVNRLVDHFVSYYKDLRSREARKQVEALEKERQSADQELRLASARLESFKRGGNISSLPDQTRVALERASTIDEARNTAEARLREVNGMLASVQTSLARTPATREIREQATRTALVDKLRLDVNELQRALDKELTSHTEDHPNVQRLRQELAEAQGRLEAEATKLQTTVRVIANPDREVLQTRLRELTNERDGLVARVASLNGELARVRTQVSAISGKDVELSLLQQRYNLAEQRLTGVVARLGHVRNAANLLSGGSPIAVVDRSGPENPPYDHSIGRTLRLTALAFVMSLAMCIGLAVGLELLDRRIRNVEDAEQLLALPVASVVPQLPGRASTRMLCLAAENTPNTHLAEAYHFLASHLLRKTLRRESTVLMAATAKPGQGATTALSNLAIALARAGRRVVLVEADLRRPFLHQAFECDDRPGLSDVLQGHADLSEALTTTQIDNLRLLPAGSPPEDPWSLLMQPSLALCVEELRETADYVLFNVPSATVFADALCVAAQVDGAILVMRTSEMPTGAEQKVREWLEELEVPVMGVVLNGVPQKEMESAEFHRSYTARRVNDAGRALGPGAVLPPVRRSA